METKKRVAIVRTITLISFLLNCTVILIMFWTDLQLLERTIVGIIWLITQAWNMLFMYANLIYDPPRKFNRKKRKVNTSFWYNIRKNNISRQDSNKVKLIDFIIACFGMAIILVCGYRFLSGIDLGYAALANMCIFFLTYLGVAGIICEYLPDEGFSKISHILFGK